MPVAESASHDETDATRLTLASGYAVPSPTKS